MIERLTIMERARPKDRPRFSGHAYTSPATRAYEQRIRDAYIRNNGTLFQGAVTVHLEFMRAIPKSWNKNMQRDARKGRVDCTTRPDLDNLIKSVLDGLQGVAFLDDRFVTGLIVTKGYADNDCIRIAIEGDTNEPADH